jgi:hypothetical protein
MASAKHQFSRVHFFSDRRFKAVMAAEQINAIYFHLRE